jgi:acyl-CoA dehydrogenase-like protein
MIDAAERALLETSVRGAIADACAGASAANAAAAVDAALSRLGWLEMLGAEPCDAVDIVFTALGAAAAAATVLDDVIASALGAEPRAGLVVLLPRFGASDPPGRLDGEQLDARGLATARAAGPGEILVVCRAETGLRAATVPIALAEVRPVHGIDPDAGLRAVRVQGRAASVKHLESAAWDSALALGRRAVAHEIAGACRAMLGLASAHARERVQFGRPIARFQAVRHRLAEALVALEALEATLAAATDEPGAETAALAKATAGRSARTVGAHCQQVLAGIGFTTEHPFHRFLKRTIALEGLFGSADAIVLDVGRRLIATRRVPTLIEL